jgi:DNA mismatch endonuclease (patch repair protein)
MPDNMSPDQRRRLMSRVRNKGTAPELKLRRELWRRGYRYRLDRKLPGKPDLSFLVPRVVVFVDGCFWHCCPEHATYPATRAEFWHDKLRTNVERDRRVSDQLRAMGWTVLRFWEHEVNDDIERAVAKVATALDNSTVLRHKDVVRRSPG